VTLKRLDMHLDRLEVGVTLLHVTIDVEQRLEVLVQLLGHLDRVVLHGCVDDVKENVRLSASILNLGGLQPLQHLEELGLAELAFRWVEVLEHGGPEVSPRLINTALLELFLHRVLLARCASPLLLRLEEPLVVHLRDVDVLKAQLLLLDQ
jgi:hypothetical protein